ncbi:MAG TPA: efflux RND transporter periplasmic adaptor subunit [Candidatus Omnitrophota bacterium]|nr:efflux RND transporter periplasmic adaptor subunit [Candidatus Omnitrophota bacterium]HPT06696.1 efflux RND transporter periplasmic adaptor subunit [Candidatus Omnitrophota bacterium]
MNKKSRTSFLGTVCLILAVVFLAQGCGLRGRKDTQQKGPEVKVVKIQTERVVLTSELPGRTVAYQVADIRPQVSGLIIKRVFEEGAFVKEGALLYQIDPAPYQAAYNQARAAVAMIEANLPAVRLREQRFKELVATHAVGQQDYDNALATLHLTEAQMEASKAALEMAKINLSYTPIKSPISGRIGRSSVTEGAMVTAYQSVALATVQALDPIYVDVPQSTTELLRLQNSMGAGTLSSDKEGQNKVTIIREDGSPYPIEGVLRFRDVTVSPTTGSVILRIVVPNPDSLLLPGMFVRAVINEGVVDHGILITQSAVSRDQKGQPYVFVVDAESKASMRMITVDRVMGNKWVVSSGLSEGDQVIVEGLQRVRNGVSVTVAGQAAE